MSIESIDRTQLNHTTRSQFQQVFDSTVRKLLNTDLGFRNKEVHRNELDLDIDINSEEYCTLVGSWLEGGSTTSIHRRVTGITTNDNLAVIGVCAFISQAEYPDFFNSVEPPYYDTTAQEYARWVINNSTASVTIQDMSSNISLKYDYNNEIAQKRLDRLYLTSRNYYTGRGYYRNINDKERRSVLERETHRTAVIRGAYDSYCLILRFKTTGDYKVQIEAQSPIFGVVTPNIQTGENLYQGQGNIRGVDLGSLPQDQRFDLDVTYDIEVT